MGKDLLEGEVKESLDGENNINREMEVSTKSGKDCELEKLITEKGRADEYKLVEEDVDDVVKEENKDKKEKNGNDPEMKVETTEKNEFVETEVEGKSQDCGEGAAGGDNKRSIKSKFKQLIKKWKQ